MLAAGQCGCPDPAGSEEDDLVPGSRMQSVACSAPIVRRAGNLSTGKAWERVGKQKPPWKANSGPGAGPEEPCRKWPPDFAWPAWPLRLPTHARASFVRSPRPLLPCTALRACRAGRVRAPSRVRLRNAIGRCDKIRYAVTRESATRRQGSASFDCVKSGAFVPFILPERIALQLFAPRPPASSMPESSPLQASPGLSRLSRLSRQSLSQKPSDHGQTAPNIMQQCCTVHSTQ